MHICTIISETGMKIYIDMNNVSDIKKKKNTSFPPCISLKQKNKQIYTICKRELTLFVQKMWNSSSLTTTNDFRIKYTCGGFVFSRDETMLTWCKGNSELHKGTMGIWHVKFIADIFKQKLTLNLFLPQKKR